MTCTLHSYQTLNMWTDGTISYTCSDIIYRSFRAREFGVYDREFPAMTMFLYKIRPTAVLCEKGTGFIMPVNIIKRRMQTMDYFFSNHNSSLTSTARYTVCPQNHIVHSAMACDRFSGCWLRDDDVAYDNMDVPLSGSCPAPMAIRPPSMRCERGGQRVPYSLVCDGTPDCADSSDEDFCEMPDCDYGTEHQCTSTKMCVSKDLLCDLQRQCADGSDEEMCYPLRVFNAMCRFAPARIDFILTRGPERLYRRLDDKDSCPHTHYLCAGNVVKYITLEAAPVTAVEMTASPLLAMGFTTFQR